MWQKKAYVLYWWRNRLKNLVNSLAWTDSLEKTLMLGKFEGRRKREQQRMRCLDGITDSMDMGLRNLQELWWTGKPGVLQFLGSQRVGHNWVTELNWCFLVVLLHCINQNTGLPSAWEPKGCPSTQRQELWTFHLLIPGWPWASHLNLFFKFSIYKTKLPLNLPHCRARSIN